MSYRFVPLVLLVLVGTAIAQEIPGPTTSPDGSYVEARRAKLLGVARELRARPVAHLSEERRRAREEVIRELERYAEARRFTANDLFPGHEVSYFVDRAGNRCQLAAMIERKGGAEVLESLVATENNAFVSQIASEAKLLAWLDANGLTIEEAAFIQDPPGYHEFHQNGPPGGGTPVYLGPIGGGEPRNDGSNRGGEEQPPAPPPAPAEGTAPRPTGGTTRAPARNTGSAVAPARPNARKRGAAEGSTWSGWWEQHREEFVNVRRAYHDRHAPAASTPGYDNGDRGRRPSARQLSEQVLPALEALAAPGSDVSITALLSLVRARGGEQAADSRARLVAYLRTAPETERDWALLALAWHRDPEALPLLTAVLLDSAEGRKLFGRSSAIPERARAHAAIALGRCGVPSAAEDLLRVLQKESGALADLRAAAITAIGMLARDAQLADTARPILARALRDAAWPAEALAQIPLALAAFGDAASLEPVLEVTRTFKGSPLVRRSAAIALGRAAAFSPEVSDALRAVATRDPDAPTRQFAICALGEIVARAPETTKREALEPVASLFHDGISGFLDQPADRPSYSLAAAMLARRHSSFGARLTMALVAAVQDAAVRDDRTSAIVALGMVGNAVAQESLRGVWAGDADPVARAFAGEALALCGSPAIAEPLAQFAESATDAWVARRAAQALGMIASPEIVGRLVAIMAKSKSDSVRAGVTRAIGEIGDAAALPTLLEVAKDVEAPKMLRERAIAALGLIAQPEDLSWTVKLRPELNFTAATPTLSMLMNLF